MLLDHQEKIKLRLTELFEKSGKYIFQNDFSYKNKHFREFWHLKEINLCNWRSSLR